MEIASALQQVQDAVDAAQLTPTAAANLRRWLTEPRYREYVPQVLQHIAAGQWKTLDDVFWTVIPFGTGGRRGRMYPIGCNAINDRTIGESAQGLADYVRAVKGLPPVGESGEEEAASAAEAGTSLRCAIAYDSRHRSREFAELCAGVMAASGFTVFFLDGYRSTPQLSFLVRDKACDCGIMVTASHNPPSDNAVKVYWSTGGQVLPPHDKAIVERVMAVEDIRRVPFAEAVAAGRVILCTEEVDRAYVAAVVRCATPGPRKIALLYSPLHGVGEAAVVPVLAADGFSDVEVYAPHRQPDGDFPNVPGHVANPENPAVFDMLISRAAAAGHALALATDPDCDRMGCAAPRRRDPKGPWGVFTGNQLAALLTDYVCQTRQAAGQLTPRHFVVTTLVTTPMVRKIAESYGVAVRDQLHVGFKWIAREIDEGGPDYFLFGTEESHGYLAGTHVRDKDGAVACMLLAELASRVQAENKSLWDRLESLYWQHGYHAERQINLAMEGSSGMARMQKLMERLRTSPPQSLAGIHVQQVRDYQAQTVRPRGGPPQPLSPPPGQRLPPPGDLVILDLAIPGQFVAVRPSGTEPKIKFYLFASVPPEQMAHLDDSAQAVHEQLARMEADLRALAAEV